MKKRIIIGLFSCLMFIQIATPISMIVKREVVLKNGKQFKFKTEPIDPVDAFRGRYVALKMESNSVPKPKDNIFGPNQKVYAYITLDKQGFASFSKLTTERPKSGDYLKTTTSYGYYDTTKVFLNLPFDRYYMEEKAAPIAEIAYEKHNLQGNNDAYVTVRIKSGFAVLEELYIGGKPILEFIQQSQ